MAKPKHIFNENEKQLIIALYEIGNKDAEIAKVMRLPFTTFKSAVEYNGLTDTIKECKDTSDKKVEISLYKQALNGNITACIFWLCNRHPDRWHNVNRIEHTGNNNEPIEFIIKDAVNNETKTN